MRSKLYSRNSARPGRYSLVLAAIAFLTVTLNGCQSNNNPTYTKDKAAKDIEQILRQESGIQVKNTLAGSSLWIYIPVEGLFEAADKPEKNTVKFKVEKNENEFNNGEFLSNYLIKAIPEQISSQDYKINKKVSDKVDSVWRVLRRVIFSMHSAPENQIKFYVIVIADIKNGFEVKEFFYALDLKKVSYGIISLGEFQHRVVQNSDISAAIIGDKQGVHLDIYDIPMEEFISKQVTNRINLKFGKPEVEQSADIDMEIEKIVRQTLRIYDMKQTSKVQIYNAASNKTKLLPAEEIFNR